MYNTNGAGAISGIGSADGARRTTALDKIKNYMLAKGENTSQVSAHNKMPIFGYGFADGSINTAAYGIEK